MERAAAGGGPGTRIDRDSLGPVELPADVLYGAHTQRAVDNFPISGLPISRHWLLIDSLAAVKQAAALANRELGRLRTDQAEAVVRACEEIREGRFQDQFPVDVIQGGAGTSTNMNLNEVICNRALIHLGHRPGDYAHLHPLDHVNLGQSTNDVYPTGARIAVRRTATALAEALGLLGQAFATKAEEFAEVIKLGRTQLQDAVPMRLGHEFRSYATMVEEDLLRLEEAGRLIGEVNLGATAIGTGINTDPRFGQLALGHLRRLTGVDLCQAPDLIEATQDVGALVQFSGTLKRIAIKLSKVCNDLRLLSSGPLAGFAELQLPAVQAGSSIMPGKVNPVIPEVVNQIAFEVMGNDLTVSLAAEAGQLQLNAFEPVMFHRILESMDHLTAGCHVLAERCVLGIRVDAERLRLRVEGSSAMATALAPVAGYGAAASVAAEATRTGRRVADVAIEWGLVDQVQAERIFDLEGMLDRFYLPREGREAV